jgi:hypothetical protein
MVDRVRVSLMQTDGPCKSLVMCTLISKGLFTRRPCNLPFKFNAWGIGCGLALFIPDILGEKIAQERQ